MAYRVGTAAVLGKTNVGKSTFLNAVLGHKVVIVSDRPQTTRNRIRCIYTTPEAQVVFVDTPGLHQPVNKLSQYLVREALRALGGIDELVYMVEPWGRVDPYDEQLMPRLREVPCPKVLLVNKSDLAKGEKLPETLLAYDRLGIFEELVPISSIRAKNLDRALAVITQYLPEGEPLFPRDRQDACPTREMPTDRPLWFMVSELIREKIYHLTYQEVPYSTAVTVERIQDREDRPLMEIYATIHVARDSQKAIVIGHGGQKLKEIGRATRLELESSFGKQVFLSLRVKVCPKWTEDEQEIARLVSG